MCWKVQKKMNNYFIIPQIDDVDEYLRLSKEYNLGFEFDDFFTPKILSDAKMCEERINHYKSYDLPDMLTLHGDFFDVLVFSADEEIVATSIKRIYQSMEAAKKIGAKKVIFHSNINSAIFADYYVNNWINCNERVFKEVCSKYPSITVLIENMFDWTSGPLVSLAERMVSISNFGICLDYAHAFLSKEDVNEWCKKLSPYIKHVHINDNDGIRDLHLPLGEGKINWNEFLLIKEKFFNESSILLEVNGIENIKKSIDYIHKLSI